jgi:hypothetical protein
MAGETVTDTVTRAYRGPDASDAMIEVYRRMVFIAVVRALEVQPQQLSDEWFVGSS